MELNAETGPKESIDAAIARSLEENLKPQAAPPKPRKNSKGGRPRKDGRPNKSDIEAMQAALGAAPPPPSGSAEPDPSPSTAVPGSTQKIAVEIPNEALKMVLQFPFNFARRRTGYEGFHLDDALANELAPHLDYTIKLILPEVDSKYTPVFMLCSTLAMVGANQYMGYAEFLRRESDRATVTEPTGTVQ